MVANNEQILVQRAQQGDRDAVGELWKMHTPKLFGYLINTLKDKTVAEDVLQNTWLKAIEALPRFQEQGKGIADGSLRLPRMNAEVTGENQGEKHPLILSCMT